MRAYYKYNGKELQDELGLNMYDMDMRMYDPAIARWVVMDPVIHHSMSPYNAFDNNPVFWADPSGADSESNNDSGGDSPDATLAFGVKASDLAMTSAMSFNYYGDSSNNNGSGKNNGDPKNGDPKDKAREGTESNPVKLSEAVIKKPGKGGVGSSLAQAIRESLKMDRGSWGIGPLDKLTEVFTDMYNSYELYLETDNHFLFGPHLAGRLNVDGFGVGLNAGNNLLEDSTAPSINSVYRDTLGASFAMFSYQYIHRDTSVGSGGRTIETSHTIGVGLVQFGTMNGKPFVGAGAGFNLGFIGGINLGINAGIRKK